MEKIWTQLSEALNKINSQNTISDTLVMLDAKDYPSEYHDLIEQINRSIYICNTRIQRKRKSLEIINSIIHSGMWSMEFDEDGLMTKVLWSQPFRHMLGFTDETDFPNVLESWTDRLHPDDKEPTLKAYWRAINEHQIYDVEYQLLTKTDEYKWFRATGEVDYRQDGTPSLFIGTFIDITKQKEHDRLKQETIAATEANQAKTQFLSHMSHDIRTPINGILGMLSIAELEPDNLEKQADCRKKIRTATEHLLSLINDVLDISKLESGFVTCKLEPFSLNELLDSCLSMVRPQIDSAGLQLDYDFSAIEFDALIGSSLYLRQILINIISNAIKYNRQFGTVSIKVSKSDENDSMIWYCFKISDTGIGMSEEFLKKIFEPFSQEHTVSIGQFVGTGLGMAITKRLVDLLNGKIEVESKLHVGTCFTVTLPFQKQATPLSSPDKNPEEEIDMRGLHILLVDDNELNCEIAQYLLENAGLHVTCVHNGKQAVDYFSDSAPYSVDAILMDIMMPIMDGITATKVIRNLDRKDAKSIPILAMTANAFCEDIKKVLDSGMNAHLAKPVEINQVLKKLSLFCHKES